MSEKRVDKSKEGRHPVRSFLSFLLMLAVVLLVVLFAAYRDGTGFDILRRYLHYGRAEQAGGETVYHYDAASKNRFALLGESLAVLSDASLSLYNRAGEEVWSTPVTMERLCMSSTSRAFCWSSPPAKRNLTYPPR